MRVSQVTVLMFQALPTVQICQSVRTAFYYFRGNREKPCILLALFRTDRCRGRIRALGIASRSFAEMELRKANHLGRLLECQEQGERAPLAILALELNTSTQQLRQLLAQLQSQACALLTARAFYLAEGLKQFGLVFGSDSYARIVDTEQSPGLPVIRLPVQHNTHFAALGKLDSVVRKVQLDLAQGATIRVTDH